MTKNCIAQTVTYNGTTIIYELERKQVRNINLRIRSDTSVYVSASTSQSLIEIDAFVQSKGKYIKSAQKHFNEFLQYKTSPKQYVSGESFYLQGHELRLQVCKGKEDSVVSDDIHLILTVKDSNNFKKKERLITSYFDCKCMTVFQNIIDELYPVFRKYGVAKPALKIRMMTSRWGTCLVNKGVITLNKLLIEVPHNCVEYVILHEYCHFLQPNHSKKFYALVTMFMPDWKERKQLLEKQRWLIL
jgi:predicted metal-dependent hydrolase